METKRTVRRYGVLVKLNQSERDGLAFLREREALPSAQVLRRLLVREIRQYAGEPLVAK